MDYEDKAEMASFLKDWLLVSWLPSKETRKVVVNMLGRVNRKAYVSLVTVIKVTQIIKTMHCA